MSWKRKRIRKTGTVHDLERKVWQSILESERIILEEGTSDHAKLQAIHALNSSAKTFISLNEVTNFEERITALEHHLKVKNNGKSETAIRQN